ncbi:hypothetical protein [Actinokineospora sp.]|uniref:hypothetical protein n=1 Tax=Actinokineospora sp. TaxID=1872133 RepID=UPI0040382298
MTPTTRPPDPGDLADLVGAAVLDHPAVVRLDGGAFGTVATHLPGRRVVGVHLGVPADDGRVDAVEVAVVLAFGAPIPDVIGQLRARIRGVTGPVPVDVHVSDVVLP